MDRAKITELIRDVYIGHMLSVTHDAGWHGDNLLGALIDYKGFIPGGTNKPPSDGKMIYETQFLRRKHQDLPMIWAAMEKLKKRDMRQYLAIMSKIYYGVGTGRENPETQKFEVFTDKSRAALVGQTYPQWRHNVDVGYNFVSEAMDIFEMAKEFEKCG